MKLLAEEGIDFERVNYFNEPLTKSALSQLLRKSGLEPRDVLRTREKAYEALGLVAADVSGDQILDAIVEHPELLQRPIIERGDRAVLGRPIEKVRELL